MRHRVYDQNDHGLANVPNTVEARLPLVVKRLQTHVNRYPETAHLFCGHGAYVGAGGCLRKMLCEFCAKEGS